MRNFRILVQNCREHPLKPLVSRKKQSKSDQKCGSYGNVQKWTLNFKILRNFRNLVQNWGENSLKLLISQKKMKQIGPEVWKLGKSLKMDIKFQNFEKFSNSSTKLERASIKTPC